MSKEEREATERYNQIAEYYHHSRTKAYPEGWFFNEMLEMPAMLDLLGKVKGKRILDFGCGSGIYAKLLTEKRAIVSGFDISHEMLKIAKQNNPELDLRQGSGYNIPFKEEFDIVQASLVLDYFDDWDKVFREVKRVLKKGGHFVFSIGNPVSECVKKVIVNGEKLKVLGINNYFKENVLYTDWTIKGKDKESIVKMPGYHKTYETIIKTIIKNGFEIVDYRDAFPAKNARKHFPEYYEMYTKSPYFCVWKIKK